LTELKIDRVVIFFYYKDLSKAANFYRTIMGFELASDRNWVKLFKITPSMYLGLVDEAHGFHKASPTKPVMLTLEVPESKNVDDWYKILSLKGVETYDKPADRDDGRRVILLEDPEGYIIEIQYRPELL
jgi:catechol 2,3-dioxygenase-like lactoylglutathione lyase family enzyme